MYDVFHFVADGERVEKCGLVDFDPRFVNIQPLQKDTFYLYTGLPVPPCTNIILEYVNFCYNFSSLNKAETLETVGRVYIVDIIWPSSYTVRKTNTLQANVSNCEGTLFRNGAYLLCCMSTLLDYNQFTIQNERVYTPFGVYIPDEPYSIGLGYRDNRDNDFYGYQPENIPSSGSFSRSSQYSNLPVPLISFTEKGSFIVAFVALHN